MVKDFRAAVIIVSSYKTELRAEIMEFERFKSVSNVGKRCRWIPDCQNVALALRGNPSKQAVFAWRLIKVIRDAIEKKKIK